MLVRGLPPGAWARLIRDSCRAAVRGPQHVFLCIADHYEPDWGGADDRQRLDRVERWMRDYPRSVDGLADSLGRPPQHTFFFPLEEYRPRLLERLAELCHRGWGEVEVHLHHDQDTSPQLREKFEWFRQTLHREHGLLCRDSRGEIRWGFIHGNWALDNSHPQGRWCGVNDELTVLRETGCYADLTMPSAPDLCQTRTINGIYYAVDDPVRPKSHDVGTPAAVGRRPPAEGLLMIQGPLALDWRDRKAGLLPRLENADLHARRPPSPRRVDLWLRAAVGVQGQPQWTFIKLHAHGAKPANADVLLGPPMQELHRALAQKARADADFHYYYATARQLAELVHAAEAGETDPRCVLQAEAGRWLVARPDSFPNHDTAASRTRNC